MSHTIQQILSRKGSSRLEHFMLLSLMILLQQTLRSFSSAETCFSSTGHESPVAARAFHKASLVLAGLSDKRDFYRTPFPLGFLLIWDQLRAQAGLGDQITTHPAAKWTLITCLQTLRFSSFSSLCHPELECNYSYLLWLTAHELLSCTSSTIWHLFVPN